MQVASWSKEPGGVKKIQHNKKLQTGVYHVCTSQ